MVTSHILHSTISGEGETIVMLHGYMSSGHYYKHVRPLLDGDYRIVALDLLGFGRSPKPHLAYTYEDHISAIQATLKQLNITNFVLLGHSMGALIALRYAIVHPEGIRKLLLFNPPLFTDESQMVREHKATGRRYRIMLYSRGRHIYWLTLRLLPKNKSKRRPSLSFSDIISMSPAAREGSYRNVIAKATVFQDLHNVTMPTLLLNGRYDRVVYLENIARHTVPSNVTVKTMEAGHHPLVRNVEESVAIIRQYLKSS